MKGLSSLAILAVVSSLPLNIYAQRGGMGGRGGGMGMRSGGGFSRGGFAPARGPVVSRGPVMVSRGPVTSRFSPAPGFRGGAVIRPGFASGRVIGVRTITPSGRFFVTTRPVFFNRPFFFHSPFFFRNRFFFHNRFFFGPGFGFGFGFGLGFPFSPFYPYYSYIPGFDTPYPYSYSAPPQPVASDTGNGSDTQLAMDVQRLSDEVESMREEQRRTAAPAREPGVLSAQTPALATFIFTDGRHITTENYAITGQTLWILSEHTARKYPLSELDRPATERVNGANGVDLHLPDNPR